MKYSREQLKRMAVVVMQAKKTDMVNYMRFMITMSQRTGLTPGQVENRISVLAK